MEKIHPTIYILIALAVSGFGLNFYQSVQDNKRVGSCLLNSSIPTSQDYYRECGEGRHDSYGCHSFLGHNPYLDLYSRCLLKDTYTGESYNGNIKKCLDQNQISSLYEQAFIGVERQTENGNKYRSLENIGSDLDNINQKIRNCVYLYN